MTSNTYNFNTYREKANKKNKIIHDSKKVSHLLSTVEKLLHKHKKTIVG